jgi:hypothetical protein
MRQRCTLWQLLAFGATCLQTLYFAGICKQLVWDSHHAGQQLNQLHVVHHLQGALRASLFRVFLGMPKRVYIHGMVSTNPLSFSVVFLGAACAPADALPGQEPAQACTLV